ncbi:hypothetical protein O181_016968 [Austropuccinia psidii MF-1]|uniref:Uncharacterized protein n=1 Tax=Austropuccinia psidii MF-1 TaxID=1389203 RepID=A0A9Q3C688_9BASI|nr:hypothetical protein [Austropuccinia psidii MF-1]
MKNTPRQPPETLVECNPMQMVMQDAPPDFKCTKEALYVHVELLWGMLTPASMQTAPDELLLKEFYQQFSSVEEVQSVAQNSNGVKLVKEAQVQRLHDVWAGKRKVGNNVINMEDFYITSYWNLTIKDYEIDLDTPKDSDNYSVSISDSDKMIDLDVNNKIDVEKRLVEQEIIKNEQREVELVD